jgi:hypothetical protein
MLIIVARCKNRLVSMGYNCLEWLETVPNGRNRKKKAASIKFSNFDSSFYQQL